MRRLLTLGAGLWLAAAIGVAAEPPGQSDSGPLIPLSNRKTTPTATATADTPDAPAPATPRPPAPSPLPPTTLTDQPCCTSSPFEFLRRPAANGPCDQSGRFWVTGEYLYWHADGFNVPPLITTSPPGTPQSSAGVLGAPGTAVVLGGERLNDEWFTGLRFGAGVWLDECQKCGIEGNYFFLFDDTQMDRVSSTGTPILARPFFNVALGRPDAELIAFPGLSVGSAAVQSSFAMQGGEVNLRHNLCRSHADSCDCSCGPTVGWRVDALLGYRYLRLHEDLAIVENLTAGPNATVPGANFLLGDFFRTENRFNGGQFGLSGQVCRGRLSMDVTGTLAIGATHEVVSIAGVTTTTAPGMPAVTQPGGLLALGTNSGRFVHDEIALVPQLGIRFGYQLWGGLRTFVGYDLLYWSRVVRPGDQIDLAVNPTQLPPGTLAGVARPIPTGRDTDILLQGLTSGIEWRW
jgi:hypothetical protein